MEATPTECFSHEDCTDPEFCAWVPCQRSDGTVYSCGRCRSCAMCLCDTNATDFECPRDRCPNQPTLGILYWQGIFYGSVPIDADPSFVCFRRLAIFGNMLFFLQVPVSLVHPASSATLDIPNSSVCKSHARSGVLRGTAYQSSGQYTLDVVIASEGASSVGFRDVLYC